MRAPMATTDHQMKVYHGKMYESPALDRADLDRLRELLPDYLAKVHGILSVKRNFKCINPKHNDLNPSMVYNPATCTVHCFGCGAHGDIFDVAGWDTGATSFRDKIAAVCAAVGARAIAVGQAPRAPRKDRAPRRDFQAYGPDVKGRAVKSAFRLLSDEKAAAARKVLQSRGFKVEDVVVKEGVGWCSDPNEVMPGCFPNLRPRPDGFVVLPFPNDEAWSAVHYAVFRPVGADRGPKEIKPSGCSCPIYTEHLLRAGSADDRVYVVEGPFDAIALRRLIPGAKTCALCGGNVGRLLDVLASVPAGERPSIVLAFDDDDAGRRFTNRAKEGLSLLGVRHGTLPPFPDGSKDANECLKNVVEGETHGNAA